MNGVIMRSSFLVPSARTRRTAFALALMIAVGSLWAGIGTSPVARASSPQTFSFDVDDEACNHGISVFEGDVPPPQTFLGAIGCAPGGPYRWRVDVIVCGPCQGGRAIGTVGSGGQQQTVTLAAGGDPSVLTELSSCVSAQAVPSHFRFEMPGCRIAAALVTFDCCPATIGPPPGTCPPIACPIVCPNGYKVGPDGCETCECIQVTERGDFDRPQ